MTERISEYVRRELARFGPAAGMAELVEAWPSAVGDAIARNAWPARFGRDGTLHVATSSSAWAFELAQLERTLRERLVELVGDDAPARLRFAPGRLPETVSEPPREAAKSVPEPSAEQSREAAELAASIEDESLRKLVARAAAASLARASADRPL